MYVKVSLVSAECGVHVTVTVEGGTQDVSEETIAKAALAAMDVLEPGYAPSREHRRSDYAATS